jgi:hypothetical protein
MIEQRFKSWDQIARCPVSCPAFSLRADVGQGAKNVGAVALDMIIAEAYGRANKKR